VLRQLLLLLALLLVLLLLVMRGESPLELLPPDVVRGVVVRGHVLHVVGVVVVGVVDAVRSAASEQPAIV
jgi:hypothetical protein